MREALEQASLSNLDNLTAIIDVNRLGQRGETIHGWDLSIYSNRARSFGWHSIEIDGHDVRQIDSAYSEAILNTSKPTVIIARTIKGKGVSEVENVQGAYGKKLNKPESAIRELGGTNSILVSSPQPINNLSPNTFTVKAPISPIYKVGEKVATREAYGKALEALGSARTDVVALDAEVSNSTFTDFFAKTNPERYFEMHIAEQQMIAAAVGIQVRNWVPFASSFAAFLSRAYDFIRMASYAWPP